MSQDINDTPSIDIDAPTLGVDIPDTAGPTGLSGPRHEPGGDIGGGSGDDFTDVTIPEADDLELDNLFLDPRMEQILKPYEELTELLHVAHGDQLTIGDLLDGINRGDADTAEAEMFREMVRVKGAEPAMQWLAATQESINHMAYRNGLTDTVMRGDSRWLQGILIDGQVRGGFRPNIKNSKHRKGERLSGRDATVRVRQEMGIGDFITFPLPHSGIWMTLLVEGEGEMVNFHTRVLASKSHLGRRTAGLVFSNSDVIILRHLWDMLSRMVVSTSMGKVNKKELSSLIKIQDIPLIVGYYMAARFSSGYTLAQPCQVDPAKCGNVDVHKVNINRMLIVDNARLTEAQAAHMRKMNGHTAESVLAYQAYFSAIRENVVNITPTTRVVFGVPTVDQKLEAGMAWLDSIEDSVTLSFKDELTRDQRIAYINKQAAVTALRNYSHWVKRIDLLDAHGELDGYIEGEEDIYAQLSELNKDEEFKKAFYKEINIFMNEMTVGVVALPRYKCTKCGQRQPAVGEKFPAFTPVNMERAFFTLLTNTLNLSMQNADI